ncbi:MAG: O-antigen ligase family protein [candidate division WOR-3 bacterium]
MSIGQIGLEIVSALKVVNNSRTKIFLGILGIFGFWILAKFLAIPPVTVLVILGAIGLLAVGFLKPMFGLLIWAGLLSFQIDTNAWLGVNIAPADFILLAVALGTASRIANHQLIIPSTKTGKWLLGLVILFTVGLFVTLNRFGSIPQYALINKYFGLLFLILTFYVVVTLVDSERKFCQLIQTLFWIGVIGNYLALFIYFLFLANFLPELFQSLLPMVVEGSRLRGFLLDPNAYGGFIALTLMLQIIYLPELPAKMSEPVLPKRRYSILAILNTISLIVSLFLTFSRSAWLGFAIGLLVLLFWRRNWGVLSLLIFGAGVMFLGWMIALLPNLDFDYQFFIFRTNTFTDRLTLIDQGWQLYSQSPIFGIGLGVFHEVAPTIIHNSYIWLLVELGPLALLLLLGLFITALKNCLRVSIKSLISRRLNLFLLVGLVSCYGLALGIEAFYQRHLWLLIGLAEASSRIYERLD